jgi:hypothetical protein
VRLLGARSFSGAKLQQDRVVRPLRPNAISAERSEAWSLAFRTYPQAALARSVFNMCLLNVLRLFFGVQTIETTAGFETPCV